MLPASLSIYACIILASCHRVWFNAAMDDFASVVKGMRVALGDSQQAFAVRLGMSIRAIGNYERGQIPDVSVVYRLHRLATENGLDDAARFLGTSLQAFSMQVKRAVAPNSDDEKLIVRMILPLFRNRNLVPHWNRIIADSINGLKALAAVSRTEPAMATDPDVLDEILADARERFGSPRARARE